MTRTFKRINGTDAKGKKSGGKSIGRVFETVSSSLKKERKKSNSLLADLYLLACHLPGDLIDRRCSAKIDDARIVEPIFNRYPTSSDPSFDLEKRIVARKKREKKGKKKKRSKRSVGTDGG